MTITLVSERKRSKPISCDVRCACTRGTYELLRFHVNCELAWITTHWTESGISMYWVKFNTQCIVQKSKRKLGGRFLKLSRLVTRRTQNGDNPHPRHPRKKTRTKSVFLDSRYEKSAAVFSRQVYSALISNIRSVCVCITIDFQTTQTIYRLVL